MGFESKRRGNGEYECYESGEGREQNQIGAEQQLLMSRKLEATEEVNEERVDINQEIKEMQNKLVWKSKF